MVLDNLGDALKNTLKKLTSGFFVNERIVNELIRDIQRALLQADVHVQLVFELTKTIKRRALDEKPKAGITQREHLIKVVYEELVRFFGEEKHGIILQKKKPFIIMLAGLFGSGKTTTIGKLAHYYAKRGQKVAVVGLDVHRPAASEQLKQIADKLHIPYYIELKEKDALKIYKKYQPEFSKYDVLLVDTAGRDALSKDLIEEIESVTKLIQPDERLLVLSADIGQAARAQAEQFYKSCGVTGVILTKLDGTAKGGGALSACAVTGAPVKFIGVGEKMDDLELFNPSGFVGRLLGMGDLEALLEKAKDSLDETKAEDLQARMLKGEFNLIDVYEQLQAMRKMGPLSKVMEMIPGMSGMQLPKDMVNIQEEKLQRWKYILDSCTKKELEDPEILTPERMQRIAQGSGTKVEDVRDLLKQYRQIKKVMKVMKGGKGKDPQSFMKKMMGKFKAK